MRQQRGSRHWLILSISTLAAFVGTSGATQQPKGRPQADKQEMVLFIGPFSLGQLYREMPDQTLMYLEGYHPRHLRDRISADRGIPDAEVVKALDQCKG